MKPLEQIKTLESIALGSDVGQAIMALQTLKGFENKVHGDAVRDVYAQVAAKGNNFAKICAIRCLNGLDLNLGSSINP